MLENVIFDYLDEQNTKQSQKENSGKTFDVLGYVLGHVDCAANPTKGKYVCDEVSYAPSLGNDVHRSASELFCRAETAVYQK